MDCSQRRMSQGETAFQETRSVIYQHVAPKFGSLLSRNVVTTVITEKEPVTYCGC